MTYSEFRSKVFQCLSWEDDDSEGYDTIVDCLSNGDPDQMAFWFKQVMNDWRSK